MFLLVVACLVASASACCMPTQWEARLGWSRGTYFNASTQSFWEGGMAMSYDAVSRRIVQFQRISVDGNMVEQKIMLDYRTGIMSVIDSKGACTKMPTPPWYPNCIPENATTGTFYFGQGNNIVRGRSYYVTMGELGVSMTVTADTCVPMTMHSFGKSGQTSIIERLVFVNVTMSIRDRSVFNAPSACDQVAVGPSPGLGGKRALHGWF